VRLAQGFPQRYVVEFDPQLRRFGQDPRLFLLEFVGEGLALLLPALGPLDDDIELVEVLGVLGLKVAQLKGLLRQLVGQRSAVLDREVLLSLQPVGELPIHEGGVVPGLKQASDRHIAERLITGIPEWRAQDLPQGSAVVFDGQLRGLG
jgi:hypothetical protein